MKRLLMTLAAGLPMAAALADGNLVRNPSFEGDEKAFVVNRMETPRERVKAKDDPRYVSRPDTLHFKDGKRAWFLRCENTQGRNNMIFTDLPVTPGKRYVFKAYYYLDDAEGPTMVWGNYHEHGADGKTSGYRNLHRFDATPVQWNEFTCTFYASPKSTTVNVELIFGGKMSVWVDLMTGWVYELPSDLQVCHSCGVDFVEIPVYDSPCVLIERKALDFK